MKSAATRQHKWCRTVMLIQKWLKASCFSSESLNLDSSLIMNSSDLPLLSRWPPHSHHSHSEQSLSSSSFCLLSRVINIQINYLDSELFFLKVSSFTKKNKKNSHSWDVTCQFAFCAVHENKVKLRSCQRGPNLGNYLLVS